MALMTQPERVNIVHELDTQFPLAKDNFDPRQTSLEELPTTLLEDIFQRLEDARSIARVQLMCKEFRDAGNKVRSLRFVVLEMYHERARDNAMDVPSVLGFGTRFINQTYPRQTHNPEKMPLHLEYYRAPVPGMPLPTPGPHLVHPVQRAPSHPHRLVVHSAIRVSSLCTNRQPFNECIS